MVVTLRSKSTKNVLNYWVWKALSIILQPLLVIFDVPSGKTITEIVVTNQYGGTQLGRWTVT
jgi:hypothetical protein